MNRSALDIVEALSKQLGAISPNARSLSVTETASWLMVRIGVITDEALWELAEELGLEQARTSRRGQTWFRWVESRRDGLIVVAAGPAHAGTPPEGP